MRALALIAVCGGCIRGGASFQCASDSECMRGTTAGRCEAVDYCSFPDPGCASGSRFGDLSGPYANQCVGQSADAGVDMAGPPVMPVFVKEAHAAAGASAGIAYALPVPPGTNRFLLISLELTGTCDTPTATVTSVSYAGVTATQLAAIVGTPCGPTNTRSEQWGLVAPTVGAANVVVTLSAPMPSVRSAALLFTGVRQAAPVRGTPVTASGASASSTIDVPSAAYDLVVDTIGQGCTITGPTTGTQLLLDNGTCNFTLDNAAASSAPGAAGTVTMAWAFTGTDEWQTIGSSLQPP
jgi:hypothetical protein